MTHDEIVALGKKFRLQRSYRAMHDTLSEMIITPEQLRYMSACGTAPVAQLAAHQKVLAYTDELISGTLSSIEIGLAKYRAERGKTCADMFLRHYKFGEQIASIGEHYKLSPSTIKRRLGLVETPAVRTRKANESRRGTLQMIPLGLLVPNPLNHRSMGGTRTLAEAIRVEGLLQPLTVYATDDDSYVLIAGHRRLAAMKSIDGVTDDVLVPCYVIPKPATQAKEEAMLAAANIGRRDPKNVAREIQIAGANWDAMCQSDRVRAKELVDSLKNDFIISNQNNPAYHNDPVGYVSRNFRPKISYIQLITGLPMGKTAIKEYMSSNAKTLPRTSDYATEAQLLRCVKSLNRKLQKAQVDSSRKSQADDLQAMCVKLLENHKKGDSHELSGK